MRQSCILIFLCTVCYISIIDGGVIPMSSNNIQNMPSPAYHVKQEDDTRHIYITPLAIFLNNQTTFVLNTTPNRTTMIIPLILYIDEQIEFIRANYSNECLAKNINCVFHEIPIEMMRLVNQSEENQPNLLDFYHRYVQRVYISANSDSFQRILNVHFDCKSKESCINFELALHQSSTSIGLHLDYAIHEIEIHQMIISDKHRLASKIHLSEFILENHVEELCEDLLRIANIRDNEKYILSQTDLFELKKTLREHLIGDLLSLTAESNETQWNNLYWPDVENTRPDRILKLLNTKRKPSCLLKYNFNNATVNNFNFDGYVQQIYEMDGYDLYLKYRHLFQTEKMDNYNFPTYLTLKQMLVYELKKYKPAHFLIHQPVHLLKRDHTYSLPISSHLNIGKMHNYDTLLINIIKNNFVTSTTSESQLLDTTETTVQST